MARATRRAWAPSCRSRSMRRRSAAALSTTTPRPDSSSATRRSSTSDGDSSPRTSARSTFVSPRASHGSTGQATNSAVSATANVSTSHGSRTNRYSEVRHATGSFRCVHSRSRNPASRSGSGLGSSTSTPSSVRARARSNRPTARHPRSPSASNGSPTTVTASSPLTYRHAVTYTNPRTPSGRLASRWAISHQVRAPSGVRGGGRRPASGSESAGLSVMRPSLPAPTPTAPWGMGVTSWWGFPHQESNSFCAEQVSHVGDSDGPVEPAVEDVHVCAVGDPGLHSVADRDLSRVQKTKDAQRASLRLALEEDSSTRVPRPGK